MRRPIASLLAIAGGLAVGTVAAASTTHRTHATTPVTSVAARDTVTGCLEKGSSSTVYKLVEKSGQAVNVKSSSVSLGGHVGHEVTLTTSGMAMANDTTPATVTKMKMVSTKCAAM